MSPFTGLGLLLLAGLGALVVAHLLLHRKRKASRGFTHGFTEASDLDAPPFPDNHPALGGGKPPARRVAKHPALGAPYGHGS